MRKICSLLCALAILFVALLPTTVSAVTSTEKTVNDFESYSVGTNLATSGGPCEVSTTGNGTVAITAATRNNSTALKLNFQGSDWNNITIKVKDLSNRDFTGQDGFNLWIDASDYNGMGLTLGIIDGSGVRWNSKNPNNFNAADSDKFHYVFDFDQSGVSDEVGSSGFGNLWLGSSQYVGILRVKFADFSPETTGATFNPDGIQAIIVGISGSADNSGDSFYIDNITMGSASVAPGVTLPADKKVVQDFSPLPVGAVDASLTTIWPERAVQASVVANSGGTKKLGVQIKDASQSWIDFGVNYLKGNWAGATYLAYSIDVNGMTDISLQPVITDASNARYDFLGASYILIDSNSQQHVLNASAGQCVIDSSTYGEKVTLVVPFSDFQLSHYGAAQDSEIDYDGILCARVGFPVTSNDVGKTFYITGISVYGTSLQSEEYPSLDIDTPAPPRQIVLANYEGYSNNTDLSAKLSGWPEADAGASYKVTQKNGSKAGMYTWTGDDNSWTEYNFGVDTLLNLTNPTSLSFWIDASAYSNTGISVGLVDLSGNVWKLKNPQNNDAADADKAHYTFHFDDTSIADEVGSSGWGNIWLASDKSYIGTLTIDLSEFEPFQTSVDKINGISAIRLELNSKKDASIYFDNITVMASSSSAYVAPSPDSSSETASSSPVSSQSPVSSASNTPVKTGDHFPAALCIAGVLTSVALFVTVRKKPGSNG